MPLADDQREVLEELAGSRAAKRRDVQRARALLRAADGVANTRIGELVGVSPTSVRCWRQRFLAEGFTLFGPIRPGPGARAADLAGDGRSDRARDAA